MVVVTRNSKYVTAIMEAGEQFFAHDNSRRALEILTALHRGNNLVRLFGMSMNLDHWTAEQQDKYSHFYNRLIDWYAPMDGNGMLEVVLTLVLCMQGAIDDMSLLDAIFLEKSITMEDFAEIVEVIRPYATSS